MKTIIEYQCEICGEKYDDSYFALDCEKAGLPDTSKLPIGLMHECHHHGFVGIFAIARVDQNNYSKHCLSIGFWACRSNVHGDSLGEETCGGQDSHVTTDEEGMKKYIKWHSLTDSKVGCPEYERMVKYLKSQNIVPLYYNEQGNLITIN